MLFQVISTADAANQLFQDDNATWTYAGACAMAEYLDELHEDCGGDWSFNVIEVRCQYTEYTVEELIRQYGRIQWRDLPSDPAWAENCEEFVEEFIEALNDHTMVIEVPENGNYIVSDF